jgi:RNA polymerase sigma factor (sigma-70 family)
LTTFSKHTDDASLWNCFRQGDENAYTELARRYYRMLFNYGQKFCTDQELIEDALQDLLIHLWLHRSTIGDTGSVKFYLIKSFRHRLIKALKAAPAQIEISEEVSQLCLEDSTETFLIREETAAIRKNCIRQLINKLPSRHQEVIYLRFYENLKPEEIGKLLSIHPQSASNIIQRALCRLRELWPASTMLSFAVYSFSKILF